ncbi:hypothetical protein P7K49_024882 [Saguinus oedipus]|uniref:T-box domain-containing protein n=1 Tax=Saguinus oedipus TaxID=9490 RepID=A0ABQ9UFI0_SAGOE|nr:hypothetical protein P7K49_024882 [Saguinus oedipus]
MDLSTLTITKLKIDSNPFAKGFRDSSRLTDIERARIPAADWVYAVGIFKSELFLSFIQVASKNGDNDTVGW